MKSLKNLLKTTPLLLALTKNPSASAQNSIPEINQGKKPLIKISTRTDFFTQYILRGFALSEKPVVQPTLTIVPQIPTKYGNLSITGLGNYDSQTRVFNEADILRSGTDRKVRSNQNPTSSDDHP